MYIPKIKKYLENWSKKDSQDFLFYSYDYLSSKIKKNYQILTELKIAMENYAVYN